MVSEKASVLPSKTVPELGATVTVICGVGGVVDLPPGPLAQAVRERAKARRKIVHAGRRWMRGLRVERPCVERVCERGRMVFAIADEGPAKEWVATEAVDERPVENLFPLKCVERRAWSL